MPTILKIIVQWFSLRQAHYAYFQFNLKLNFIISAEYQTLLTFKLTEIIIMTKFPLITYDLMIFALHNLTPLFKCPV